MRHKRLIISAILLLGLIGLQAQAIYVKESSGTQTAYSLNNIRKMNFSSGNLTITKNNNTSNTYSLNGLCCLSFTDFSIGVNELWVAENEGLNIYPNPASNMLNIDLSGVIDKSGKISIFNFEGRELKIQQVVGTGILSVEVDISQLPKGIYICRYSNEVEVKIVKIIKQ